VEARANKDLDVSAHALPVVMVLRGGQGRLVTCVSSPITKSNYTECSAARTNVVFTNSYVDNNSSLISE
jgi:hypothetical protein